MYVYRSETGQWNENLLSGSEEDSFLTVFFVFIIIITKKGSDLLGRGNPTAIGNLLIVVAYNAKLYWYNSNCVEVYGPFNDCPAIAIFIHGSETALARTLPDYQINRSECLGVFQGFLRYGTI